MELASTEPLSTLRRLDAFGRLNRRLSRRSAGTLPASAAAAALQAADGSRPSRPRTPDATAQLERRNHTAPKPAAVAARCPPRPRSPPSALDWPPVRQVRCRWYHHRTTFLQPSAATGDTVHATISPSRITCAATLFISIRALRPALVALLAFDGLLKSSLLSACNTLSRSMRSSRRAIGGLPIRLPVGPDGIGSP